MPCTHDACECSVADATVLPASPAAGALLLLQQGLWREASPLERRVQARLSDMQIRPQRLFATPGTLRYDPGCVLQALMGLKVLANSLPEMKLYNHGSYISVAFAGVTSIEFTRLLPSPGSLSITIKQSMRMASIFGRLGAPSALLSVCLSWRFFAACLLQS